MPNPITFSKLEVINQALTGMGEPILSTVNELSGTAKQAVVMRAHYEAVVYFCMTRTSWRFATAKASLNKIAAPVRNRWSTAWQLPADLLKVLTTWPMSSYEIQNRQLLTDNSSRVDLDYIRLVQEAYWPAWFLRYVVAELLIRTKKGITGESPEQEDRDERTKAENDALYQDSQQQPNQVVQSNDFIDCRA